ncbi:hypothetical protein JMJ77_0002093, partial [Colletotrichum scovillei]
NKVQSANGESRLSPTKIEQGAPQQSSNKPSRGGVGAGQVTRPESRRGRSGSKQRQAAGARQHARHWTKMGLDSNLNRASNSTQQHRIPDLSLTNLCALDECGSLPT